jgi:hypothetical protein
MFRGMIELRREDGQSVVKTMPEVAAAFDMAPQSVKGDWRDGGMPGRPGHWDLAEILAWRIVRDGRARGAHVDTTPLAKLIDAALEKLSEEFGVPELLKGAGRLSKAWDATLAECEVEDKKRAAKARKQITK